MSSKKSSVKRQIAKQEKKEIPPAESKTKGSIPWAMLLSVVSIVVAIVGVAGSYWYNYKNYSKQYDEDVRILIARNFYDDYNTRIVADQGKAYIFVNFNCETVNNSEKPVLLTNFESLSFDSLRSSYGLFTDTSTRSMIKLPVKIESKESKHFVIQELMIMDTLAYNFLKLQQLDLSNISNERSQSNSFRKKNRYFWL